MNLKLIPPQKAIVKTTKPLNLTQAGQGGGKSHVMGPLSAMFISNAPKATGLIAANTREQLTKSTLVRIFKVWRDEFGWEEDEHYVIGKRPPEHFKDHGYTFDKPHNIIFFINGAIIFLASLENYKAIDGQEIAWAMLDETKDTREVAITEVITGRLRQKTLKLLHPDCDECEFRFCDTDNPNADKDINPLFIFTSPAKEQWLSKMFSLENHREDFLRVMGSHTEFYQGQTDLENIVIYSSYLNKANLPDGYIENREAKLPKDLVDLNIHGSPYSKSGQEYYSNFDRIKHIKPCKTIDNYPIHLGFDFNANPYMTGLVCQMVKDNESGRLKVRFTNHYAAKTPNNNIRTVCSRFLNDNTYYCRYGFFFYGDSTGNNSLPLADYKNYFDAIEQHLASVITPGHSRRLLKQNPRHRSVKRGSLGRREFLNMCLSGKYGFDIEIDPSCNYLIDDLEFILEDPNGAKSKKKEMINDVMCEKLGHMSDAMDSILCYVFGEYKKE